jgi:hypothetical protein
MTKEELRKEATFTIEWGSTPMIDRPLFVHAYITGALPREEQIAELEKENAELKERCSILNKSLVTSTKNNIERQEIIDELKKQLTKAEQFLKEK